MNSIDQHLELCKIEFTVDPAVFVRLALFFLYTKSKILYDEFDIGIDLVYQGFSDYIHSATDFESAKRTCNETLYSLNAEKYAQIKAGNYFWIERDTKRSVEETVSLVEKHLGLV